MARFSVFFVLSLVFFVFAPANAQQRSKTVNLIPITEYVYRFEAFSFAFLPSVSAVKCGNQSATVDRTS